MGRTHAGTLLRRGWSGRPRGARYRHGALGAGRKRNREAKEGNTLGPITMTLYYATDFADRLENEIIPALRGIRGAHDRYIFSSWRGPSRAVKTAAGSSICRIRAGAARGLIPARRGEGPGLARGAGRHASGRSIFCRSEQLGISAL